MAKTRLNSAPNGDDPEADNGELFNGLGVLLGEFLRLADWDVKTDREALRLHFVFNAGFIQATRMAVEYPRVSKLMADYMEKKITPAGRAMLDFAAQELWERFGPPPPKGNELIKQLAAVVDNPDNQDRSTGVPVKFVGSEDRLWDVLQPGETVFPTYEQEYQDWPNDQ